MFAILLCGGPPLADPCARMVDLEEPSVQVSVESVAGGTARFRITGDYQLVDGQCRRVYRYVDPAESSGSADRASP